jgi:hypothetical protein
MFTPYDIANIILHVTLISAFIGIFFFTYVSKIEGEIVKEQVDYIVKDFLGDVKSIAGSNIDPIKKYIDTIQPPNLDEEDKAVEARNSELFSYAMKIILGGVIIGFGTVYWMYTKYGFDIMDLIKTNLIILAFVALVELGFLTFFGAKFRSGDPNYVKKALIDSLITLKTK